MFNKFIDLERLTTFFQGLKDIFLQKSEAIATYATKTEVENKVDKVVDKGLSTLDYTPSEKSKVDNSINQISVTQNTDNVELNLSKVSGNVTAYIDEATSTKAGALSNTDKAKLDEIPTNPKYTDTIYTHPANHSADIITESTTKRFVSDAEKTTWNNKQGKLTAGTNVTITGTTISATDTVYDDTALKTRITAVENREDKDTTYDVATTSANGLMSSADKVKLNGIEAGSQKNIMTSADKTKLDGIETGAEKNNVTSTDIENWNNKVDKVSGKQLSTNDYTTVEKNKLEGIEVAAQKNTVTSVQGRTGAVTISKSDVGLGSVNNVAITAAQVTKLNELNYNRAMTEAQYEALSQTEKDRSDVWYGIYKE